LPTWRDVAEREYHAWTVDRLIVDTFDRTERECLDELQRVMSDPIEALILDLLESLASNPRPYSEIFEAWRTSCPRLPVWEEAHDRGFIRRHGAAVCLTSSGRDHLAKRRGRT
jgi:D-3-phosphoglycerate dehydrogenase